MAPTEFGSVIDSMLSASLRKKKSTLNQHVPTMIDQFFFGAL
jgi:hypothetical protein